ncbi:hypothetical protein INT80_07610 [Gallibacterium anatis]|uniref:Tetratricopeptide repeat protein n=1 Tax=Gallibacterium anatis TaxID=750 RepID=A0A930UWE7_9PAST|nr:hypothetical protein [Gallibacterium anatis]
MYAHMGLLYAKVGDTEKAFGFYQKEENFIQNLDNLLSLLVINRIGEA